MAPNQERRDDVSTRRGGWSVTTAPAIRALTVAFAAPAGSTVDGGVAVIQPRGNLHAHRERPEAALRPACGWLKGTAATDVERRQCLRAGRAQGADCTDRNSPCSRAGSLCHSESGRPARGPRHDASRGVGRDRLHPHGGNAGLQGSHVQTRRCRREAGLRSPALSDRSQAADETEVDVDDAKSVNAAPMRPRGFWRYWHKRHSDASSQEESWFNSAGSPRQETGETIPAIIEEHPPSLFPSLSVPVILGLHLERA